MAKRSRSGRSRGRPVSESVDRALTAAALAEFTKHGFRSMSMESIAARAGVSKVSLYRRWKSKLAVAAEILKILGETSPVKDQGSLKADVQALLEHSIVSTTAKADAKIVLRMMGEISGNPKLLALYRKNILAPRIGQLRTLVERARNRDELHTNLSVDVICLMIAGPLFLYYLTVFADADVQFPSDLSEQLTAAILGGIAD